MSAIEAGTVIGGDFRVEGLLREGAAHALYSATQESTGRRRALLVASAAVFEDDRERFLAAARSGASLASERFAEVIAAGIDEATGAPFVATALVDGEYLTARIALRGPLRPPEARAILGDVAGALAAAHAEGLAHGGLSADRVYLAGSRKTPAERLSVGILDLGIAALLDAHEEPAPPHRAPEQRAPEGEASPAADVWALGLVTFLALTGKPFLQGEPTPTALARPASARAAELGVKMYLPPSFDAWLARCLAPKPADRFRGAAEAFAALDAILARGPWSPPLSSATLAGVGLAVVVALAAAGMGAYFALRRPPDPARDACIAATGKMVAGMQSSVQIDAWVTGGSPKRDAFLRDLRDLLERYQRESQGKLSFTLVDARSNDDIEQAVHAGLQSTPFAELGPDGKEAGVTRGVAGLVVKVGSENESIPILTIESPAGLPFWITNKIREVRARAEHRSQRIGLVTGKHEIKISDPNLMPPPGVGGTAGGPSLKGILEQAMPFYAFEDVDLQGRQAEIPAELGSLIITQPADDFTDAELGRIDAFVMRGNKGLLVIAGAVNVAAGDAAMRGHLSTHGLEKLTAGYGVEMKRDSVLDWSSSYKQSTYGGGSPGSVAIPALVLASSDEKLGTLDASFIPFFRLDELILPFPSTLVPHPEKQPSARLRVVAKSSKEATTDSAGEASLAPTVRVEKRGAPGQSALGVSVEGTVNSAFGSGSAERTRILVIASSQLTANPLVRAGAGPTPDEDLMMLAPGYAQRYLTSMILAFKNTLDWMGDDEYVFACSAVLQAQTR